MPLCPPAPIIRTTSPSSFKCNFDIARIRSSKARDAVSADLTGAVSRTANLFTGTIAFLTWTTAFAAIALIVSGDANLLLELAQYTSLLFD